MLCLIDSGDVRALLREVLFSAGYNAVVTAKLEDAKILLKAMKATTVVVSAHMQSGDSRTSQQVLQEINPAIRFLLLDQNFAAQDPGEAMQKLLATLSKA